MTKRHSQTGELALIAQIRAAAASTRIPGDRVQLGIGDDCAILTPPRGSEIVVTTDFSLESRHFLREKHPPQSIGHRVLARGLSDLAAMGAQPLAAFLSLALPKELATDQRWLTEFLDGLTSLAKSVRVPLAGGDTSESPSRHMLADIVLLGSVPRGNALRRSGANPGDLLYVTGTLGGSAAELAHLLAPKRLQKPSVSDFHPHFFPTPRLAQGRALTAKATACIDISDGLSTDLAHLCEASAVSAEIDLSQLPLSPGASLDQALHGGEDYELLFTAPAKTHMTKRIAGVPITKIGRITRRQKTLPQIIQIAPDGTPAALSPGGWEHLR